MSSQRSVESPQIDGTLVIVSYSYYYDTIILISSFCLYHTFPVLLFPLVEFINFQGLKGDLNASMVFYRHVRS